MIKRKNIIVYACLAAVMSVAVISSCQKPLQVTFDPLTIPHLEENFSELNHDDLPMIDRDLPHLNQTTPSSPSSVMTTPYTTERTSDTSSATTTEATTEASTTTSTKKSTSTTKATSTKPKTTKQRSSTNKTTTTTKTTAQKKTTTRKSTTSTKKTTTKKTTTTKKVTTTKKTTTKPTTTKKVTTTKKTTTKSTTTTKKTTIKPTTTKKVTTTTKTTTTPITTPHSTETTTPKPTTTKTVNGTNRPDLAIQLLTLANEKRAEKGLHALTLNASLTSSAELRATEVAIKQSHTRPNGTSFRTTITIPYTRSVEIIAWGGNRPSPEAAVTGWYNSPVHKRNLLHQEYTEVGVGCYSLNKWPYWCWVMIFIKP